MRSRIAQETLRSSVSPTCRGRELLREPGGTSTRVLLTAEQCQPPLVLSLYILPRTVLTASSLLHCPRELERLALCPELPLGPLHSAAAETLCPDGMEGAMVPRQPERTGVTLTWGPKALGTHAACGQTGQWPCQLTSASGSTSPEGQAPGELPGMKALHPSALLAAAVRQSARRGPRGSQARGIRDCHREHGGGTALQQLVQVPESPRVAALQLGEALACPDPLGALAWAVLSAGAAPVTPRC